MATDAPHGISMLIFKSAGAGKTTLVDIILGLLQPSQGVISVDNVDINKNNLRSWQQSIGYVPQEIFLIDASVSENIALGVPVDLIDQDRVKRCANIAQVHDFVENDCCHLATIAHDGAATLVPRFCSSCNGCWFWL